MSPLYKFKSTTSRLKQYQKLLATHIKAVRKIIYFIICIIFHSYVLNYSLYVHGINYVILQISFILIKSYRLIVYVGWYLVLGEEIYRDITGIKSCME